ncbi:hypothetical protein ACIG53_20860 [Streptomyces bauhiniae]|uniref:hypothetical protein n=1 Tax=Streptomyces bauhiniae TaxID=2340725 RepID=UPI0037D0029A
MTQGGPPPGGNIIANKWLRVGGHYYCRGWRPTGEPRVIAMTRPPYGKTVWVADPGGGPWASERLPFRLTDGAKFWLGTAVVVAVLVPLMLSGHDPIMWHVLMPVAVGFCLLCAYFCQIGHLYPHDDISQAEAQEAAAQAYAESEQLRAKNAALQQAKALQNAQAWQAAIWAQVAQINQAQHPGQDIYRPYGQSPPL